MNRLYTRYIAIVFIFFAGLKAAAQTESTYELTVRLIKPERTTPICMEMSFALVQKFEVIESNFAPIKPKYPVLLIQPCPELLHIGFFRKDALYKVVVAQSSNAPFTYTIVNNTGQSNIPFFWIRTIEPITNQLN